jgi:hypothetical protein
MSYTLSHYAVAHHQATLAAEASANRIGRTVSNDRSFMARIADRIRPTRRVATTGSQTAAAGC